MKNRICAALFALCAALALAACAGGDSAAPAPTQPAAPAPAAFHFTAGGTDVAVGDDMAGVLAALGEPRSYFEAASCAFDGLDKTYTYPGFTLTTRPEGEKDYVNSILLTDDSAATPEGVYIGSSAGEVTAAYGESLPGLTDTVLSYVRGGTAINFILEDGKVISIEYLPA